jgi:hypothetical protein
MTHICALTGQSLDTKGYILRTTDGPEEIISPEALFHPEADAALGELLADMAVRISRLEEALETRDRAAPAADVQADQDVPAKEEKPQATAAKKVAAQRKASD